MSVSITSAPATIDSALYRDRIRNELVAAMCSRLPTTILIEIVLSSAIIAAGLWEITTPLQLTAWLAVHFLIVLLHGYVYLRFQAQAGKSLEQARWLLVLCMFLVGVFWAVLLAFLFAEIPDYLYRLYIFLFVAALGVLAVVVTSEDLLVLMAFVVPNSLAISLMALGVGQPKYVGIGLLGILSTIALVLFARTRNRSLVESLTLRFATTDLAIELREQRDAAQRANVAKSKFLAAASHDLRQPLHALTLLTTALHDSQLDATARGIANDMSGAIGSLEKMFGALLDISKLDAGVLHPEPLHFDVGLMLRRIADEFSLSTQAKGLNLICQPGELIVHTDAMLLERIVRNYVANAVRYTQAGTIRIACQQLDRSVRIEVADTGIGIAAAQQTEIFDEFYQVDNPERDRSKGLGLGLAIVRRIAELLQLNFGVESAPQQGATFFVTVPCGDPAQVMIVGDNPSASRQNLAGLRVLVIDDDVAVRASMSTLLGVWHCQAATASDAEQGVVAARAAFAIPDAMIVDYRLRDQRTGIEAIAHVRSAFGVEIPALIVSGDTAPERLREVAESGHTLIHKPAQPAALRAFLLSTLRLKNLAP